MKKVIGILFITIAVVLVVQGVGWGVVPEMITFQGRLTDTSGNPVTATQKYKFSLRNSETAGTELWAMSKVFTPNSNGVFEVTLTGGAPDLSTVDLSSATGIWLKIDNVYTSSTVGIQQLKSVPFALRAKVAEGITWPIVKSEAYTGRLLSISNTTAAGTNYTDNAAYFYSKANAGVRVEADRIGLLGTANYDPSAAPTDENLESAPNYGIWAGVSGKGYEVPGVGAVSEKSYGIYAKTESAGKPGILGLGSKAGVEGRRIDDEFHFGTLGGTNPIKISGSTFKGITRAGAHGQVYDGNAYGVLGYLHKTYSSDPDSDVPNYGVYGRTIKGKDSAAVYGMATEGYGGYFATYSKATRPGVYADSAQIGPMEEAPIIRTQAFTATFNDTSVWPLISWTLAVANPTLTIARDTFTNNMIKSLTFDLADADGTINIVSIDRVARIANTTDAGDWFELAEYDGTSATWNPITKRITVARKKDYPFIKAIKVFVTYSIIAERQLAPVASSPTLDTTLVPTLTDAQPSLAIPSGKTLPSTTASSNGDLFFLTETSGVNPPGMYNYITGLSWHRTAIDTDLTYASLATTAGLKAMAQKASLLAADIPTLDINTKTTGSLNTSRIPALDASKITTGTLPSAVVTNTGLATQAYVTGGGYTITSRIDMKAPSADSGAGIWMQNPSGTRKGFVGIDGGNDSIGFWASGWKLNVKSEGVGIGTQPESGKNLKVAGISAFNDIETLSIASSTAINVRTVTFSDIRLKSEVTPLTGSLSKVAALQGVSYKWKDAASKGLPSTSQLGLIAQDVERVVPELVTDEKDGYKAINYNGMSALFVEAIKELKAENETLKARIQALEQKVR